MSNEKQTGSYYTPKNVIEFMIDYLKAEKQDFSNVLEPSAGDGRFLSLLLYETEHIDAIEIAKEKVENMKRDYAGTDVNVLQADFLDYVIQTKKKYSLIIGNPPYISPKLMEKSEIEKAKCLCGTEGIATTVMQNMWLAFVVGACQLLKDNGTIFFVLPMEFLQVQYAEKLRIHLENKFNIIHIISFQKPIFPEIEQEVCLVYMTNKEKGPARILYKIYKDAEQRTSIMTNIIEKNKPLQKWSNAILADTDIFLLKNKSEGYKKVEEIGITAPGIVTGGNKYFILSKEQVEEYECQKYVIPILQKSSYVTERTIMIDKKIMRRLRENNKPMYLLNLAKVTEQLPEKLWNYLEKAGDDKRRENDIPLKERFKCANRTPWYGVPIVGKGDVIFFKRYDILPRVYINEADIHTTDAGYHIKLKEGYESQSFTFCFYNSLTLAQCEYNGRYYGGGVRELVPSEFKNVTIPYRQIEKSDVVQLKKMFKKKASVESIIEFVNSKTINLDMEWREVQQLESIRRRLVQRRNILLTEL